MTEADSVHSTPPTNTSLDMPLDDSGKPVEGLYLPTDTTPEQLFQAIGRLRKDARDEIDRLIRFLDETDNHMELEEAVDDVPCDDRELEPSLCGVTADPLRISGEVCDDDLEGDDTPNGRSAEDEPSLGTVEVKLDLGPGYASTQFVDQSKSQGNRDDCEGDEHDGREQDSEDEGAQCEDEGAGDVDREPSLGWTVDGCIQHTGEARCDAELQDHATVLPVERRTAKGVAVEDRFCGRTVIRNLTDGQQVALAEKIDRHGRVSIDTGNTRGLL